MSWITPLLGFATSYRWWIVGGAFLALSAALGVQTVRLAHAQTETQEQIAGRAQDRAAANAAALAQDQQYRAEEARRTAATQEAIDAKDAQLDRVAASLAARDAAERELRQRFAAATAASRAAAGNPAPSGSSQAAPPGDLPTDMFGGVLAIAGQYRDAAEDAITRGELCERIHGSLTP